MAASARSLIIDNQIMAFLLGAVGLVSLPHALHIPIALFGFFLLTLGWRFAAISNAKLLPGRMVLFLLAMLGTALIIVHNQGIFGRDAGTSLFIVALGLKLLEVKQSRDVYLVVFLSFFVATTQFLYSQSLLMAFYVLMTTCCFVGRHEWAQQVIGVTRPHQNRRGFTGAGNTGDDYSVCAVSSNYPTRA